MADGPGAGAVLPVGTVTLIFTDVEGSAELWERHGPAFQPVLDAHNRLLREAAARWQGREVKTEGDAFFLAFDRASDAVRFAVDAQLALARWAWPSLHPEVTEVRVRIGMHTGEPLPHTRAPNRHGTPVGHSSPSTQGTHIPTPSQTPAGHGVPAGAAPVATHTGVPREQSTSPALHVSPTEHGTSGMHSRASMGPASLGAPSTTPVSAALAPSRPASPPPPPSSRASGSYQMRPHPSSATATAVGNSREYRFIGKHAPHRGNCRRAPRRNRPAPRPLPSRLRPGNL